MIFFTADLHFDHANIIKFERRHFMKRTKEGCCLAHTKVDLEDLHDMNESYISRWNIQVTNKDKVFILGDFYFGNKDGAEKILSRLNGEKFLVRGNHDEDWARGSVKGLAWIKDVYSLKNEGERIWLSHYAHRAWPASHHGSWHLFGHSHNSLPSQGKSFDVGVDTRSPDAERYLYSFDEVRDKMRNLPDPRDLEIYDMV